MVKPYIPPPRGSIDFPAMFWDPKTKKAKVYNAAKEVPDGHLNAHPDDEAAVVFRAKSKEVEPALTREEIIQELTNGGVKFRSTEGTPALYNQLLESLRKALVAGGIEYPENADAKALLELLTRPA